MPITLSAPRRRTRLRAALAALATALLVAIPTVLVGPTAAAATPGISAQVLHEGVPLTSGTVVREGDTITLKVQYNTSVTPGSTHTFRLGGAVTLHSVPAGNAAVDSIDPDAVDPELVHVTFRDPWPSDVNQGVFELSYVVSAVSSTGQAPVTYEINGEGGSIDVIVRNDGDEPANVTDAWSKSVAPGDRNNRLTVAIDPVSGGYTLTIDPALADDEFAYTLRIDSDDTSARMGYPIVDELPAGYGYVAGSFESRTTTWDASGWNMTTSAWAPWTPTVTGGTFAGAIDLPATSITEIRYRAEVVDWPLVRDRVQDSFDTRTGAPGPGGFSTTWTNTAGFGPASEETREASFQLGGTAPGPVPGNAFAKWSNWPNGSSATGERTVDAAPDGTLTPALDIRYSLGANLSQWDGRNTYFTLDRNVVIEDVLPTQFEWSTDATDVVRMAAGSALFDGSWDAPGAAVATLTEVTCPATRADFALTSVGSWCIDGQRLWVNAGQDTRTELVVEAQARLTTTAGLTASGTSPIVGGERLQVRNGADFVHRDGATQRETHDDHLIVRPQDQDGGVNDSRAFVKERVGSGEIMVDPGDTAAVPYRFTVRTGVTGTPAGQTRIVDHVDTDVFDISDPGSIPVSGDYSGTALTAADFVVTRDGDALVIELSAAGAAKATAPDGVLVVDLVLTTRPFVGKETMTIRNEASLFGLGTQPGYWSGADASATSFGNEAEVTKHVYDRVDDVWTAALRAQLAADGTLVEDVYVYRITFIPHGSFGGVEISPVVDELPDAVEFLGFVDVSDIADPASALQPGPLTLGGNLLATHDATDDRVTISQQPGTLYTGGTQAMYFAVRVLDASAPVVNQIDGTSVRATIEPFDPRPAQAPSLPDTGVSASTPLAAGLAALGLALGVGLVLAVAAMRHRRV